MKLDKGLEVLEVLNTLGDRNKLYLTFLYDKDNVVLVDTGIPGSLEILKIQMNKVSVPFEKLSKVIITHQDFDHMGGLSSIVEEASENQVEVLCHESEKEYIEGSKTPIKLTDDFLIKIRSIANSYTYKKQKEVTKILDNYYAKVDNILTDGQFLDICGGINIIHTPGHTPGHICLYLKKYKTLIAGDALTVINGELYGPNQHKTLDLKLALNSLNKLTEYNIKTVICCHGGIYNKNVNKRIPEVIKSELNEIA